MKYTAPLIEFRQDELNYPIETANELFAEWLVFLTSELFGTTEHGMENRQGVKAFSFGNPSSDHFVLRLTRPGKWTLASASGLSKAKVKEMVDIARAHTIAGECGEDLVYQTEMKVEPFGADPLNLLRDIGNHVPIQGRRRLGSWAVLDFISDPKHSKSEPLASLLPPKIAILVTLFVPGPIDAELSRFIAAENADVVASIIAFALDRPVQLATAVFAVPKDSGDKAGKLRHDSSILGFGLNGVSLDYFGVGPYKIGTVGMFRFSRALLSYHSALRQFNADVSTMLMVIAMEAFIAPTDKEWGAKSVAKRFRRAVIEVCPEAIDEALNHPNVEEAFGYSKRGSINQQRVDLLHRVYELRSMSSHFGISPSRATVYSALAHPDGLRMDITSNLSRAMLFNFMKAPRSFMLGHPSF
jgi:hypothetical protein